MIQFCDGETDLRAGGRWRGSPVRVSADSLRNCFFMVSLSSHRQAVTFAFTRFVGSLEKWF